MLPRLEAVQQLFIEGSQSGASPVAMPRLEFAWKDGRFWKRNGFKYYNSIKSPIVTVPLLNTIDIYAYKRGWTLTVVYVGGQLWG